MGTQAAEYDDDDEFVISVYYQRWTPDDIEFGEPGETGVEIERETVDADNLKQYAYDHNISDASSSDPRWGAQHIWFRSTSPIMNREYIEHGIEKHYSLHIHAVNGHEPEAEDIQRIANLIGVKFDNPIVFEDDKPGAPIYGYYINLDERGDFYADVRDSDGQTVFEIRAGNSLLEDVSSIFEDGFMRDKNDLAGLTEYLRELGVIQQDAQVLAMTDFEQRMDALTDDAGSGPR